MESPDFRNGCRSRRDAIAHETMKADRLLLTDKYENSYKHYALHDWRECASNVSSERLLLEKKDPTAPPMS